MIAVFAFKGAALPAVAWGCGSGPTATLSLLQHGNTYSTLRIANATGRPPEGARAKQYPASSTVFTDAQLRQKDASACIGRDANDAAAVCGTLPPDFPAAPAEGGALSSGNETETETADVADGDVVGNGAACSDCGAGVDDALAPSGGARAAAKLHAIDVAFVLMYLAVQ